MHESFCAEPFFKKHRKLLQGIAIRVYDNYLVDRLISRERQAQHVLEKGIGVRHRVSNDEDPASFFKRAKRIRPRATEKRGVSTLVPCRWDNGTNSPNRAASIEKCGTFAF